MLFHICTRVWVLPGVPCLCVCNMCPCWVHLVCWCVVVVVVVVVVRCEHGRYNLGISKPGSVDSGDLANTAKAVMDSASSPYDSATIGRDSYDFYAMIFPCLPVSWGGLGSVKGSKAWYSVVSGWRQRSRLVC